MTYIRDAITASNPWWNKPFTLEYNERELYSEVKKYLPMRHMIAFTGLRRVGKTTLMMKIIQDALSSGRNPLSIFYFSFDAYKEMQVQDIISCYEEVTGYDASTALILFDEIQKVQNWSEQIKRVYDTWQKCKIILSGSESLFIHSEHRNTLAGRMFEFQVKPLSFREYCVFTGMTYKPYAVHKKQLMKAFKHYCATQGFPEMTSIKEQAIIQKYIEEGIVEKVIYHDLQELRSVKDVAVVKSLFSLFYREPGQIIELEKLSQRLGITRQTIAQYLSYLEDCFLLQKLYNYSTNARKSERKLKKYYPALISPLIPFGPAVFEWILVRELHAEFFWRDPYKNEVDIVKNHIPIEVKYGAISETGVEKFLTTFKSEHGIILTWDDERTGKIKWIPALQYLLEHN